MLKNKLQNNKHENKERLCYCCNELQESAKNINNYVIKDRGFGSLFQDDDFAIQLCDACKKNVDENWFNNNKMKKTGTETYLNEYSKEEDINDLIESFIVENQEYVLNCNIGILDKIDRDDWIKERNIFNNMEVQAL